MNNFDLHERATELMDEYGSNAYQLAKKVAELEEELKSPNDGACCYKTFTVSVYFYWSS